MRVQRLILIQFPLFIVIISGLVPVFFEQSLEIEDSDDVRIGTYYYLWWGIPFNYHWNSVTLSPLLGRYNSNDSLIAEKHILLAREHGVDFFAVSWLGRGEWVDWDFDDIDSNLKTGFLGASNIGNFSFSLFYETSIVLNTSKHSGANFSEIFLNDLEYASQNYFIHPSYMRVGEKPVLFLYNVSDIHDNPNVSAQDLLGSAKESFNLFLIGDLGDRLFTPYEDLLQHLDAVTTYFFAGTMINEGWEKITEYARTYYPEWRTSLNLVGKYFIPNAYPGFKINELPLSGIMFRELLDIAYENVDYNLSIMMITSWNEWEESTSIEPSLEYGEQFLHQVYAIPEFPSLVTSLLFIVTSLPIALLYKKNLNR